MKKIVISLILLSTFILNSQSIKPVGIGLTVAGTIYDMAINKSNGDLYACGTFESIDGIKMKDVGHFNGIKWLPILDTTEIDGYIFCSEVIDGALYIGGNFTINKNKKIKNLAKLENGEWQGFGIEQMSGSIRDIIFFENSLFVTGDFKSINNIKNNGAMRFTNDTLEDAGLISKLNAQGFIVSGDTLYAYGNGFAPSDQYSHSVSYLYKNKWTTLPAILNQPSASHSCIKYQNKLFVTYKNQIYVYNESLKKFTLITSDVSNARSSTLFEYLGNLCVVFDKNRFYTLKSGKLYTMDFILTNAINLSEVNVVKNYNNQLILGGYFHEWKTKSASLLIVDQMQIKYIGKVAANISHITAMNYSAGRTMTRYKDKFVIAGNFLFADGIYSPNLVYYDGQKFIPFEVALTDAVKKIEVFENELYALPVGRWTDPELDEFKLIKFNGSKWIGVTSPYEHLDDFVIIKDKLFVSENTGSHSYLNPIKYLRNGKWEELKKFNTNTSNPYYSYNNFQPYKEGIVMLVEYYPVGTLLVYLENENSEWVVLKNIEVNFDHLVVFEQEFYLVDDGSQFIYKINDNKIDTIARKIEVRTNSFFKIKNQTYFSAWNGYMYRLSDQNKLEYYNHLEIMDIEKMDENNYLFVGPPSYFLDGYEVKNLNGIAIYTLDELSSFIEMDKQEICEQNYIECIARANHINANYQWLFEGGVPDRSNSIHPMVKYEQAGTYEIKLITNNLDGDKDTVSSSITINDCNYMNERENNYDNHWIFGYHYSSYNGIGGFDFTFKDTVLSPRFNTNMELDEGSSVMSDKNGKLQFYTNGKSIRNSHHEVIKNSECFNNDLKNYSLNYFIGSQSILSIPDVATDGVYHIFDLDPKSFYEQYWLGASKLSRTTVDMRKNNERGEIINCNELIIEDSLLNNTMQATRHKNGKDWWIIVGKYDSDLYYSMLLTKDGVSNIKTLKWDVFHSATFDGQSTFSADGNYFAQVVAENNEINIWRFDNETGELYDGKTISILAVDEFEYNLGCSFSPNSRFLYISSFTQLRQIDLCDYEKMESQLIDEWDGSYEFYALTFGKQMMTPDQQIIVAPSSNGHKSFGVINKPNEFGKDCNFKQHSIAISDLTRNSGNVLSIFPHFRNYPGYEGNCVSVSVQEQNNSDHLMVFPNPVYQDDLLRFNKRIDGSLMDISGNVLFEFKQTDYLDIHNLSAGVYFLKSIYGINKIIKL